MCDMGHSTCNFVGCVPATLGSSSLAQRQARCLLGLWCWPLLGLLPSTKRRELLTKMTWSLRGSFQVGRTVAHPRPLLSPQRALSPHGPLSQHPPQITMPGPAAGGGACLRAGDFASPHNVPVGKNPYGGDRDTGQGSGNWKCCILSCGHQMFRPQALLKRFGHQACPSSHTKDAFPPPCGPQTSATGCAVSTAPVSHQVGTCPLPSPQGVCETSALELCWLLLHIHSVPQRDNDPLI